MPIEVKSHKIRLPKTKNVPYILIEQFIGEDANSKMR